MGVLTCEAQNKPERLRGINAGGLDPTVFAYFCVIYLLLSQVSLSWI
jgi:hypothetical protein